MPCLVHSSRMRVQEARRHRDEARPRPARLDDDRGERCGIDLRDQGVFELRGCRSRRSRPRSSRSGVRYELRNRQPDDLRRERSEPALEQAVLARQAEREQRAPVVAAFETDAPPGVR